MSNTINIDQAHSSGVRAAADYHEVRGSSRSCLYSLIKKVVDKVLLFFHFRSSYNGVSSQTINHLSDRTSCYAAGETKVAMLPSQRDELKMRLAPMKRELVTLRKNLVRYRKELEQASIQANPRMKKTEASRLGTQQFETYLLEEHSDDARGIYKAVTRANHLSNKIASLEQDFEPYNARLENYSRRVEFINYKYGTL